MTIITNLWLLLIILGAANEESSRVVDKDTARITALNFLSEQTLEAQTQISFEAEYTINQDDVDYIYVFCREEGKGFIMISAFTYISPIISYSLRNTYQHEDQPTYYQNWIQSYIDNIISMKEDDLKIDERTSKMWEKYAVDFDSFIPF